MDAIELLESQHREVEALFGKCEKANGEAKRQLFEKIADALAVHAAIEEKHFYPATRSARTEELLQQAVEEHLSIKRIIADLLEMDPAEAQFDARIKDLQERVAHHVEEEQRDLFPRVRQLLSGEELFDLGVVMEDLAGGLKAGGSPRDWMPGEAAEAASLQ
jgi:hemerythrin superfamily protein